MSDSDREQGIPSASGPELASPSETAAASPGKQTSPESASALRWLVTKPAGIAISLAAFAGALATLTDLGRGAYIAVRQLMFSPKIASNHQCGQNSIKISTTNVGWTSVAVGPPIVIWVEDGEANDPVGYDPQLKPTALEPGEPLAFEIKNDTGGFYYLRAGDTAGDRNKCYLRVTLPVENKPGPKKPTTDDFTCDCN